MTSFSFPNSIRNTVIACLALALLAAICGTATAEITNARYTFTITEKERVLAFPNDPDQEHMAAWDTQNTRQINRNMPFIQIQNDPTSDAPITEFRMTIGDGDLDPSDGTRAPRFSFEDDFFGGFTVLGSPIFANRPVPLFDGPITSTSSTGSELVVMFGNGGVQPGQFVRFQIDLATNPNSGITEDLPDYRTVLFDMNGREVYDPGMPIMLSDQDNSVITATFAAPGMNSVTQSARLEDPQVPESVAQVFNNNGRVAYMDPIFMMEVQVPEPNALMLAAFGLVAVGMITQRRTSSDRRQYATATASYRRRNDPRPQRQTACRHRLTRNTAR